MNMAINLSNYEAWFLDYHEGNLDESGRLAVRQFLEEHPALKEEFEAFEIIPLEVPSILLPGKERLRKAEAADKTRTTLFLAYLEGDLTRKKMADVDSLLFEDEEARREFQACRKLKLLPDYTVVFEHKSRLKHFALPGIATSAFRYAAAAILLILFLTWIYFRDENVMQTATVTPVTPSTSTTTPTSSNGPANKTIELPNQQGVTPSPLRGTPPSRGNNISPGQQTNRTVQSPVSMVKEEQNLLVQTPHPSNDQLAANPLPSVEPDTTSQLAMALAQPEVQPVTPAHPVIHSPSNVQLSDVFSEEEMEELGLSKGQKNQKNTLWGLVEKGAAGVEKLTGGDIRVHRQNPLSRESYTFAIGAFSVSHSRDK